MKYTRPICLLCATASIAAAQSAAVISFNSPRVYSAGYRATVVADFNGDGKLDLVAVGSLTGLPSGTVSVLLGYGDGAFQPPVNYNVPGSGRFVAVGDFNRDGKPDLAVVNGTSPSAGANVAILLGNGDGTFQPAVTYPAGSDPVWVAVGDFNGDGKPDLAVANTHTNTVSLLIGNGDGTFGAPMSIAAGASPASVVAADFNEDGKLDLAVANLNNPSGCVSILLGTGNGGFQPPVSYGKGSADALVVGDFNAGGKPDLAVANGDYGVSILLGAGNGAFGPPANYPVFGKPTSLAIGDFNGRS